MTGLFLQLLNVSITATWVALAVLVLRPLLKKAPKWITCLLWGVVGLRLLLPFSIKSPLSLIPSADTLPADMAQTPAVHTGIQSVDKTVNPAITEHVATTGTDVLQTVVLICTAVWLVGLAVIALYGIISTVRLKLTVRPSICYRDNISICDDIDTPFILGVVRPRIYLPSGMDPEQHAAVIAHENAHLKRKDHWWKPLGYALLAVYWFNPVLWAAYILLCRDIELACDEKVIRTMPSAAKKAYSQALLDCSCHRRTVMACPLAFGEVGVKERIRAVLHYKTPALWIVTTAVVGVAVVAVCFLTDPNPCIHSYESTVTRAAACDREGVQTFTCRDCGDSYTQKLETLSHTYGEGVVSRSSTCTVAGEQQFICTDCGDVRTEPLPMEIHNYANIFLDKEPNCTQEGEKAAWCLDCDQKFVVETIPKNDVHDMKTTVIKAATCTDAGEADNTCTLCGHTEKLTLDKLGHSYTTKMELSGTCSSKGTKQLVCDHCGKEQWYETTTNPDEHSWMFLGPYSQCSWCFATNTDIRNPYWPDSSSWKESDSPVFNGFNYKEKETFPGPIRIWP